MRFIPTESELERQAEVAATGIDGALLSLGAVYLPVFAGTLYHDAKKRLPAIVRHWTGAYWRGHDIQ